MPQDLENLEKALNFEMDVENLENLENLLKLKTLSVENLEKLFCCGVLFKFVVADLRKNKDQEEGAIKL